MQDRAAIVFVLSYACPLKCSFCCHTRDVVGSKRMTSARMLEHMQRFGAEPSVDRFCFTGGEPFLYLDDIKDAVAKARQLGVRQPFHIVTSANWVEDAAQTRKVMEELHGLGMDLLGLSYDHEHAKWVSVEQIRIICAIAAELSIKINLNGVFWHEGESIDDLLRTDELPGQVRIRSYLAVPAGRAKRASTWPRRYDISEESKYTCGEPGIYHVTIYPDGEVYPCCSGGINIDAKLSCGNTNSADPSKILRTVYTNFHARMAKEFGWGALYEFVRREAPELASKLPRFEDVDSACEICRDLNVKWAHELIPLYEKFEIEYVRTRAEYDWMALAKSDGPKEKRPVGDMVVSLDELTAMLTADGAMRANYLSGALQIGSAQGRALQPVN